MGRGKEGSQHSASLVGTRPVNQTAHCQDRVEPTPRFSGRHEDPAGRASCLGTLAQWLVPGEEGPGMLGTSLGSSP